MKRLLLILLMALIPLHTTWAAVAGVREIAELSTASSAALSASTAYELPGPGTGEDSKYKMGCCAGCHVFCHFAAPLPVSTLGVAPSPAQVSILLPSTLLEYRSYIPDGPIRPQWRHVS